MNEMIANRYVIVKKLGEGGMADVYLALDSLLNREVALKMLRGNLALDPISLLRFQREANSASALNHPNIVEIYDVGEDNGQHYIVMEYIRGKTLKQLISQRGAMEKLEAISIMDQLISAITEAHDKNIIHRDIKPQNILVKDDGTVKITDFGIATVADSLQLTQADTVLGSVHYLAPELARGEGASFQSDIYALGITFYELLTGQVPHRGDAPVQIAMKHMKEEIPSVREFNPSLPQAVENIIIKATAKNRNLRFKSAHEMREELMNCLSEKMKDVKKLELESPGDNDDTILINKVGTVNQTNEKPHFLRTYTGIAMIIGATILTVLILSVSGLFGPIISPTVEVPVLINLTIDEAKDLLLETGLSAAANIRYELTDSTEAGLIVKTAPIAGTVLERGSTVTITVSEGIYWVVGDYTKRNIDTVKAELEEAKISVRVEYKAMQNVDTGTIIEQSLLSPGDKLDPKRQYEIKFIVAAPIEFLIPQIVGLNIETAKGQLESLGASVSLNQLSTEGMSEIQLSKLSYGVVVAIDPQPLTYYTQGSDNYITLSYY